MLVLRGERFHFEHTHLELSWVQQHQINQKDEFLNYPPPLSLSPPPSFPLKSPASVPPPPSDTPSGNRISPAVLFIIIILAVLFFISGILHLLLRFLTKNKNQTSTHHSPQSSNSQYPDFSSPDALQRQLQQLFHLHDSGLDQAFIDALPVFLYKEIVGPTKEPFDCAVCLCEFTEKDKLRLLPMCSHAFHINCIDTWLLSNSTCPLCRGTLFTPGGFSMENPIFEYDEWRGDVDIGRGGCGGGGAREGEIGFVSAHKTIEIEENENDNSNGEKKGVGVFPVRLGKFRKLTDGFVVEEGNEGGETSSNASSKNLDDRRCYSMGSYQYILGDTNLRVTLCPERNHSSRHVKFAKDMENNPSPGEEEYREGKKITNMPRRDSYSVSKIWLWKKKGKYGSSSSNDAPNQMDNIANSLNMELPWMDKTANV